MSARRTALIAVDWGTTSARAYRLDDRGEVRDIRTAPLGIQHVTAGFPAALAQLLGDWIDDRVPRLACGMIGSRQGWIEAPYIDCPASFDALARGIVRTQDGALSIVPGVVCRDADGIPDVMRGEETQIAGAVAADAAPVLIVLPGTHSKWAIVDDTSIRRFATFMTGEVYAVLREHSILGRLADPGAASTATGAFERGVRRALSGAGPPDALLHRLFEARTRALLGDLAPGETLDYLSGLLIGSEIAAGRDWAAAAGLDAARALLVGDEALCARYAVAMHVAGVATLPGPRNAAAHGLWQVAQLASLVR